MSDNILFFENIDKNSHLLVGGKGANLGEMTQESFPVPPGFVVTTNGFKRFIKEFTIDNKSPEEIRSSLKQLAFPKDLEIELEHALQKFDDNVRFSVRSSATAEDLPYASFAGQQDTYLNIDKKDIKKAIIDCFASLYSDRAVTYREKNGIKEPNMAVVIQKMIDSDKSGVMFTANPVNGNRNQLVIDSIFGLGEAIVSGLVTPDHYVINKKNNQYTQDIKEKEFALVTDTNGNTIKKEIADSNPSLNEEQILRLKELGESIEDHYGKPQDIEWAIENNNIYLLQTRPITTLYPVPDFDDDKFHFMFNMGYQQMNPVAMPVLSLELIQAIANFHRYDLDEYKPSFIRQAGQHIFLDFSTLLSVLPKPLQSVFINKLTPNLDPLMASPIEELLQREKNLAKPDPIIFKKLLGMLKRFPKYLTSKDPKNIVNELIYTTESKVDQIKEILENSELNSENIHTIYKEIYLIDLFLLNFFPLVFSGIFSLKRLEEIEKKLNVEGKWTSVIQLGNEENIVTEMNLALGDLADYLVRDKELKEILKDNKNNIKEYLEQNENEFSKSFKQFLEKYGFRGPGELDISQPRWYEEPEIILNQILNLAKNKEIGSHRKEYLDKVISSKEASIEFIKTTRDKLGDRKAREVSLNLKRYRYYWGLREHLKYYLIKIFGYLKKYLNKIGEYLTENSQIKNTEDIYHLRLKEIAEALENNKSYKKLIDDRKNEYRRIKQLVPPRIITSEGEVLMGGLKRDNLPEDALVGLGVSPGQVEGIAKIVLDPNNAQVDEGEILVAPFTDPGWTPLFLNAEALVTEIGGTLTHGAVVAREYGIPGVVGIMNATTEIKNGDKILVDGSSGYVRILD